MKPSIGVFGASSMVGHHVIKQLLIANHQLLVFSRSQENIDDILLQHPSVPCCLIKKCLSADSIPKITQLIYLAPIWTLIEYLPLLSSFGVRRLVVLSSTSRFTKKNAIDPADLALAERLIRAEAQIAAWAQQAKVDWIILQPTLIYEPGKDKNISEIIDFITRFGFFPLLGVAQGLRQPIHAKEVAQACCQVLATASVKNIDYTLSGADTFSYRDMVEKIFEQMAKPKRTVIVPLVLFRCAIFCLKRLPRFRNLSVGMALRMNQDMCFDNRPAQTDFGFAPKPFNINDQG